MKLLGQAVSEAKGEAPDPEDSDCVIDIQADAHLPESYISNLSHRLEMYRRIADIRTKDDAEDVVDEMIDRFGDLPKAAEGLINVALVRSRAKRMGINAIRQRDELMLVYFNEIRCEGAAELMEHLGKTGRRANLNMTGVPHIAVKINAREAAQDALNSMFDIKLR